MTQQVLSQCDTLDKFKELFTKLYDYEKFSTPWREGGACFGLLSAGRVALGEICSGGTAHEVVLQAALWCIMVGLLILTPVNIQQGSRNFGKKAVLRSLLSAPPLSWPFP